MKVLSLIDSLIAAGAERMAVNIANGIDSVGIESHLCATHSGGPLLEFVSPNVKVLLLGKRSFFDFKSFLKLLKYIKDIKIDVLHAHSSSLFWAVFLKFCRPSLKVVWHDHYGFSEQLHTRERWVLWFFTRFVHHAFVVNEILLNYAVTKLKIKVRNVSFLANFADLNFENNSNEMVDIPSSESNPKIVCLANLRPQKDHHNLLDAFVLLRKSYSKIALYLVGGHFADDYYYSISKRIADDENLNGYVHILGSRNDVAQILSACDVGVLSSLSEGLPVSLLEYGLAKLPVVCTNVGDCSYVLGHGKYGKLVPASNSELLAQSIKFFLENEDVAKLTAQNFRNHVISEFSKEGALSKIIEVYGK
jgi:glycosyltransferase involved in cell wall biosynthesis